MEMMTTNRQYQCTQCGCWHNMRALIIYLAPYRYCPCGHCEIGHAVFFNVMGKLCVITKKGGMPLYSHHGHPIGNEYIRAPFSPIGDVFMVWK